MSFCIADVARSLWVLRTDEDNLHGTHSTAAFLEDLVQARAHVINLLLGQTQGGREIEAERADLVANLVALLGRDSGLIAPVRGKGAQGIEERPGRDPALSQSVL